MKVFILTFFVMHSCLAFTLNNSIGARFRSKRVKIMVASNTVCNHANVTVDELVSTLGKIGNRYWNTVPTSRLSLLAGGLYDTSDTDFQNGKLCLTSDPTCNTLPSYVPPVKDIVITCNDNSANFPSGNSTLAITLPNVIKGKYIQGSVILINDMNGTAFAQLDRNELIAVLAHEVGHAIGLGHSPVTKALMYYQTAHTRKSLGQDDVDGLTYLYPTQLDGCGLSLTTSETQLPPSIPGSFVAVMLASFAGILLVTKKFRKAA